MRLVSIGTDRNLFVPTSPVALRQIAYAEVVGKTTIIVLTRRTDHCVARMLSPHLSVVPTNSFFRFTSIFTAAWLAHAISKAKSASWISAQDPFESGLSAWLGRLGTKARLQLQLHTDIGSPFFARASWLNRLRVYLGCFLLPRADRLRVVSETLHQRLIKKNFILSTQEVAVLPVLMEEMTATGENIDLHERYPQFSSIILMASRLSPEKNFPFALRSFRELLTVHPTIGLVIVGAGPEEKKIQALIHTLALEKNVCLEPWAANLFSYYQSADIFLLTSDFEGNVRTIHEALAAALPIVTTDTGSAREVLGAKAGLVVPVHNQTALVSALDSLLAHPAKQTEMRQAAKERYQSLKMGKEAFLAAYRALWL